MGWLKGVKPCPERSKPGRSWRAAGSDFSGDSPISTEGGSRHDPSDSIGFNAPPVKRFGARPAPQDVFNVPAEGQSPISLAGLNGGGHGVGSDWDSLNLRPARTEVHAMTKEQDKPGRADCEEQN
jgi:hypothetical protein